MRYAAGCWHGYIGGCPHCETEAFDDAHGVAGPTEPCGDLSAAPFGGGVLGRKCRVCPTAPVCLLSHACERLPGWEQAAPGPCVGGRPPGGWSDSGPVEGA